jgi:sec-independent protein translocase protein TatA
MPHLGVPELLIILVIIVVIFGVGRLPEIGGAIGKSIREFKTSVKSEEEESGNLSPNDPLNTNTKDSSSNA